MFAFSIFWTYLWFSQFMLIWYANIPEETIYFKPGTRTLQGYILPEPHHQLPGSFIDLNEEGSKRNYGTVTMMSVLIIFGHWLDFYKMVFPR